MFAGKAGAYPSEAPFRCSTLGQVPGLTRKHQTRLERLARDKHSSLIRKSVNYGCKKFYGTGPWPFQSSLMFASKAKSLPQSVAPEKCFALVGSDFTLKLQTRLKRLARDRHFSLQQTFINYDCKKFYHNIGPRTSQEVLKFVSKKGIWYN